MWVKWTNQRIPRWKFSFFGDYLGGKNMEKLNYAFKMGGGGFGPFWLSLGHMWKEQERECRLPTWKVRERGR